MKAVQKQNKRDTFLVVSGVDGEEVDDAGCEVEDDVFVSLLCRDGVAIAEARTRHASRVQQQILSA